MHPVDLAVTAIILAGVAYSLLRDHAIRRGISVIRSKHPTSDVPSTAAVDYRGARLLLAVRAASIGEEGKNIEKTAANQSTHLRVTIAFLVVVVLASPYLGMLLTMITICLVMPRLWGYKKVGHDFVVCGDISGRCFTSFLKSPKRLFRFWDFRYHPIKIKKVQVKWTQSSKVFRFS